MHGKIIRGLAVVALASPPSGAALGRLAGHELIEVIARGGMGIVYRARQSDPPRDVLEREVLEEAEDDRGAVRLPQRQDGLEYLPP